MYVYMCICGRTRNSAYTCSRAPTMHLNERETAGKVSPLDRHR